MATGEANPLALTPEGEADWQRRIADLQRQSAESARRIREDGTVYRATPPAAPAAVTDAHVEVARLSALLNTPEIGDFLKGVQIEAAHQRDRWGAGHDEAKLPGDWAMLLARIFGKQSDAVWANDREKYMHHLITMAAICFNAHRCAALAAAASAERGE